jgi:hypothetical protein
MGQKYSVPQSVRTSSQIYDFYRCNYEELLYNRGESPAYQLFQSSLDATSDSTSVMMLRDYMGIVDDKEFIDHIMDVGSDNVTCNTYLRIMNLVGKAHKKKRIYEKFWDNSAGMERAAKIARREKSSRDSKQICIVENILLERASVWNSEELAMDSYELFANAVVPHHQSLTVSEVIPIIEKLLQVRIHRAISNFFNIREWYHGLKKYCIYDNDEFMGYFYIQDLKAGEHPRTVPLIPAGTHDYPVTLIMINNDYNLPHEITHAVQYCFSPFWEIPKDIVEIPAIMVERYFRNIGGHNYSNGFIRKHVALALADLKSRNPQEFNANFEKYANVTNAGHVASRFWHYSQYDKKYWGYVLGILMKPESVLSLPELVRMSEYLDCILTNNS